MDDLPEAHVEFTPDSVTHHCVLVCQYRSCEKQGACAVLAAFQAANLATVKIQVTSCQGQCNLSPTVRVLPDQTWYCQVQPQDVPEIIEQHLQGGQRVERLLHPRFHPRWF